MFDSSPAGTPVDEPSSAGPSTDGLAYHAVSAGTRVRTAPVLALARDLASQAATVEAGFALVAGFEPQSAPLGAAADEVAEDAALEAVLVTVQERINALQGLQAAVMAQLARRELVPGAPSRVRSLGSVDPVAVAGIDLALGAGSVSTGRRVAQAARLLRDFPRTTGLMVAGRADQTRVERVLRATQDAPAEVCRVVDAGLADRLADLDPSRVAGAVRRAIERVAPEVARRTARSARDRCTVEVSPGPDGTTQWYALLPTATSAAMWGAVTTLAAQHRADDSSLTQDHARAMALADLVLGRATVDASITLGMPVIRGAAATPAEAAAEEGHSGVSSVDLGRLGVIDAETVTALLSCTDLRVGRALLDASTGTLLETRTDAYRPTTALRRFVAARDETCRWFGCTRRAVSDPDSLGGGGRRHADIDHVVPWPHGRTTPSNLVTFCRRHHRAKQAAGVTVTMTADGTTTMRSRTGAERTTQAPARREVSTPA